MDDTQRSRLAKSIIETPFMLELFGELEHAAMDAAVWAKPGEQEKRDAALAEVRTIRNFLTKLNVLAGMANRQGKSAPA
jgi:hypothetical protein